MEKICANCKHVVELGGQKAEKVLECHRKEPSVIVSSFRNTAGSKEGGTTGKIMSVWPRVMPDSRCSKFEPQETESE